MTAPCRHLFAYGTLRDGACAAGLLRRDAWRVGAGAVQGRLYDLGRYPGLKAGRRAGERVHGELYRLRRPRRMLAVLDRYEGSGPDGEYRRVLRRVRCEDGARVLAWLYLYRGAVSGSQRIPCGDYALWRRRARKR